MKFTSTLTLALVTTISAQSLSDIPQCAVPCIDDARTSSTNCSANDYACICINKDALTSAATSCVLESCGADVATSRVLPAVNAFCEAVQSGNNGNTASSTTTAHSTTTSSSGETSSTSTSTSTSVVETTTASSGITGSSTYLATSASPTSSIVSNVTTGSAGGSSPTAVPTAGAASVVGSLAILALGIAVAL
ncbi:hypothetical protein M426DRAFT_264337 [Hypoxylon sp. CI-4A]|nr:hypothetical protein M426DRAFT_264337 [Hypoxylon sp. CI-4A]